MSEPQFHRFSQPFGEPKLNISSTLRLRLRHIKTTPWAMHSMPRNRSFFCRDHFDCHKLRVFAGSNNANKWIMVNLLRDLLVTSCIVQVRDIPIGFICLLGGTIYLLFVTWWAYNSYKQVFSSPQLLIYKANLYEPVITPFKTCVLGPTLLQGDLFKFAFHTKSHECIPLIPSSDVDCFWGPTKRGRCVIPLGYLLGSF